MLDIEQFRDLVIAPTLASIGLYSKSAERLLLATAVIESNLTYIKQVGGGPALGLFQMEPATERDIWDNYLKYKKDLAEKVESLRFHIDGELVGNMYYAAAMCRVHYLRVKAPLPQPEDQAGMAKYWKKYYNTHLGAGTEKKFIERTKVIFQHF